MNVETRLWSDQMTYGQYIIKAIFPKNLFDKFWCAWKVLIGHAYVIVRFNPEVIQKGSHDKG